MPRPPQQRRQPNDRIRIERNPSPERTVSAAERQHRETCEEADREVMDRFTRLHDDKDDYDRFIRLRDNLDDYNARWNARFPAAAEYRNTFGDEKWEKLERHRQTIVKFAAFMRKLDLDEDILVDYPSMGSIVLRMRRYITRTWGDYVHAQFDNIHEYLEEVIHDEVTECYRLDMIDGTPVRNVKEMFRRKPLYWFYFNLFFPAEARMSWEELLAWAIDSLQRDPMEPPSWTFRVPEVERVRLRRPSAREEIANRAYLEVFTVIKSEFSPRPAVPEARENFLRKYSPAHRTGSNNVTSDSSPGHSDASNDPSKDPSNDASNDASDASNDASEDNLD